MRDLTGEFTKKYDKDVIKGAAFFLFIAALPFIVFLSCVVESYVLSTLWGWYMVPFFNTKPLPLAVAFGITLIFRYLQMEYTATDTKQKLSEKVWLLVMKPVVALLLGWIGTHFL
jgi:hypothetical protein